MEQEQTANPELQRIAELLRPLWPGVVMVATPETRRLDGRQGRIKVSALVADPGDEVGGAGAVIVGDQVAVEEIAAGRNKSG